MINYLKNIKKETLIGQLPDIINSNNESIRNEFNWIFDSSLNRLTKSVYAPTGSVKAHFGEFTNLACEDFTIKNVDSLKPSIQSAVETIIADSFDSSTKQLTNHNILNHRFINSEFEESNYMHDADSIIYEINDGKYTTIKDVLDNIGTIDTSIQEAYDLAKNCDASINEFTNDIIQCNENVNQCVETIQLINTSVNNLNNQVNNINTSVNYINTSINRLNNQITTIAEDVKNLNINNNVNQQSADIFLNKNQNNILFKFIYNDNNRINIRFKGEYEHEYNFKFILGENTRLAYLTFDRWFNISNDDILFVNNDDNIKITYKAKDNIFVLTRTSDIENIVMCDIIINRYFDESQGICTMSCKTYNYLRPE